MKQTFVIVANSRMGIAGLFILLCVTGTLSEDPTPLSSAPSEQTNGLEGDLDCQCVPYFLCDVNDRIIDNGDGIIDVRSSVPTCQGELDVCCRLPPPDDNTSPSPKPVPDPVPHPDPIPQPQPTPHQPDPIPDPYPNPNPQPPSPTHPHHVNGEITVPLTGCGVRRLKTTTSRILNNGNYEETATYFAEFPWMLAVLVEEQMPDGSPPLNRFKCGASLIHPKVALTAAHCLKDQDFSTLKVRGGEWDTQNRSEPLPHQDRKVASIIIHPHYRPGPLYNDVAIIFLETPFELTDHIDTLCLPEQNQVIEATHCYATGWGRDAFGTDGSYQKILRKVDLPIIRRAECQQRLRQTRLGPFFKLHGSFVCAGGEIGKDTCQGDGGGPLVCPLPQNPARFAQVGIVSWGIGCGEAANPAVYANVGAFVDWINQQVRSFGII